MRNLMTKENKKHTEQEIAKRMIHFLHEDDETFFSRIIEGLSLQEVEEFLSECPEFQEFWEKSKQ